MQLEHKDGYWNTQTKKWDDHLVVGLSFDDLTKIAYALAEKYPNEKLTEEVRELLWKFDDIETQEVD